MSYKESDRAVYVVGLKPIYGGSIPSFLEMAGVNCGVGPEQMRVLQMCDKGEGNRIVIRRL